MSQSGKGFGKKKHQIKITDKEYEFLLLRLCYECTQIKADEKEVYPLLQTKIDILDANFINFINRWSTRAFSRLDLDKAKILGASIAVLSKAIEGIPFGNKANNLEIAIEGYKIISTFFTFNNFPEEWAQIDQERYKNDYIKNREQTESISSGLTCANFQAYTNNINGLEAQKQLLWQQIRRLDPVLGGEIQINLLKFSSAQKLIEQTTIAILSFYTTNRQESSLRRMTMF